MLKRILLCWALIVPVAGLAAPAVYELDTKQSSVGFSYAAQGATATGILPVVSAEVSLDVTRIDNSRIVVELDATRGTAGFPFANQAMRGAEMLDAARHPRIRFVSTSIEREGNRADVIGDLTIRGQTHPVRLAAEFFRQPGTEAGSFDKLTVRLTGTLDRFRWGVSGFKGLVEPELGLEIVAWINRVP